jgi:hypothetical protein
MACKYIFNGVEYKDKQTFIEEFVKPNFINQPKTLRVQEYQSDYFQKLRNNFKFRGVPHNIIIPADNNGKKVYLIDEVEVSSNVYNKAFEDFIDAGGDNQFLALLHKNDNWVTFGIKAIIQNAAKQGFSKVWLPTGNTASKVEGHTTLEEFKKQKEDRIGFLKTELKAYDALSVVEVNNSYRIYDPFLDEYQGGMWLLKEDAKAELKKRQDKNKEDTNNEINQLKQELERVETEGFETEGFGALRPIFNFYENTVTNILKKNYDVTKITDEHGNTWNEILIDNRYKMDAILLKEEDFGQDNDLVTSSELESFNKRQGLTGVSPAIGKAKIMGNLKKEYPNLLFKLKTDYNTQTQSDWVYITARYKDSYLKQQEKNMQTEQKIKEKILDNNKPNVYIEGNNQYYYNNKLYPSFDDMQSAMNNDGLSFNSCKL